MKDFFMLMKDFFMLWVYPVIAGIIAVIVWEVGKRIFNRLKNRYLRKLIWKQRNHVGELNVIYAKLQGKKYYTKKTRNGEKEFPLKDPVSSEELKAFYAISQEIGKRLNHSLEFMPDNEFDGEFKKNMLTLGGPDSNLKTWDILDGTGKKFITKWPSEANAVLRVGEEDTEFKNIPDVKDDYGIIMRVTTDKATWMTCAGFKALGTIGAGYYLAKNWEQIRKMVGGWSWIPWIPIPDFLLVVKFTNGQYKNDALQVAWIESKGKLKKIYPPL